MAACTSSSIWASVAAVATPCACNLEQNLENLRRNDYAPIRHGSPCVTSETKVMAPPQESSDASSQKPLSRSCPHDLSNRAQADQGGASLSPCTSRPCGGRGQHVATVSATFHVANSALRKWVQRFANQGPQGLLDRPRSGRPPKVTCALEQHLNHLVDQDPLQHGALSSQWSCRELATVLARETGGQLGRESVRCLLKKTR